MTSLLAAISLDAPGAVALERAFALSQRFDAHLHVLYLVPHRVTPLVEHEDDVRLRVSRWASRRVKIVLDKRDIHVRLGDPLAIIRRTAEACDAALVVVGSPPPLPTDEIARLATAAPRGLLVAHPPRTPREVVAATDLRDARFPVIKTAAQLAEGLSARVTVVHNLERSGPVLALDLDSIVGRLETLERLARELDQVEGGHVSTSRSTAEAILHVARSRDADIAVVGVRRGHGTTLQSLVADATCSILAVPLVP